MRFFKLNYLLLLFNFLENPEIEPSEPGPSTPLEYFKSFKLFFKCQFGNHKLLYSAAIDGVKSDKLLEEPVDWQHVKLIELKHCKIFPKDDAFDSERKKFLRCKIRNAWAQSFLTGFDEIVWGFRDDDGLIQEIETYEIDDLVEMSFVSFFFFK